jgi:hypothetical protein
MSLVKWKIPSFSDLRGASFASSFFTSVLLSKNPPKSVAEKITKRTKKDY